MDDVPIVLSDKWKIPPLPNISDKCVAGFFETPIALEKQSFRYDYSLEQKVLEKVEEWKIARSREIDEREQRIKLKQEEKRKRLEAEGTKLKEKLTQVSYPSPDEFSSSDDEETVNKAIDKDKTSSEIKNAEKQPFNNISSILTPTVVSAHLPNEITSSDLEALSNVTMSKSSGNVWNYNKNASKLELADFENDASDPFYSMELKTIDDLDILAQVLKTSVTLHSKVNKNSNSNMNNNEGSSDDINSDNTSKNTCEKEPEPLKDHPVNTTQEQQTQPVTLQNHYTIEPYVAALPQYSDSGFTSSAYNPHIYSNYNQSQFYGGTNYYGTGNIYMTSTFNVISSPYTTDSLSPPPSNQKFDATNSSTLETANKLRSKSVPDIVKELEEELTDSQQRRIRYNSQCKEEEQRERHQSGGNAKTLNDCANSNIKLEQQNCDDLLLKKLPKELQNLALKISQMGFPLDRVCRIAQQVHGDDKKVGRTCEFHKFLDFFNR